MDGFKHRLADSIVASAVVPASLRKRLMRWMGYRIGRRFEIASGAVLRSTLISFGDDVFVNVGLFFDGNDRATIGNNVAFGPFVKLVTATHDIGPAERRCTPEASTRPIRIEDGCWLGANVVVLPGVTVRRGCVIGASSTVTSSTEPDGLYLGTPARRVRDLPA